MGKLLIVLFASGVIASSIGSARTEPPLLIDSAGPATAPLDAPR